MPKALSGVSVPELTTARCRLEDWYPRVRYRPGGQSMVLSPWRSVHGAAALEGPPKRQLICVLEIAAHGQATGKPGNGET
ncbi:unannotated protein [freshwater metagenome]|uniref:Unannotated protein n=1 Tax=freshwater metagenome TaxID=449393 RepID=A0A6J7E6U3_9ZZZZ